MKPMKSMIQALATLLLMGVVLTGCAEDTWFQDENVKEGTYTMTVQASMCSEVTRALSPNGSTINASWAEGEEVTVYNVTRNAELEGSLVAKSSGTSTTLKGQLTGTIVAGDQLKLKFLSPTYSSQDGTLTGSANSIDKVCDYAEATVTVSSVTDGYVMTTTSASFTNQQSIVKFTLLDKGNGDAAINPTSLTISDGTSTVNLFNIPTATYTTNGNGVLYVAFPASGTAKTISLNVIGGSNHYFYEKSDVTFTNNNFYDVTVKLGSIGVLPGKFTINAGGGQVSFSQGNLQYQASTSTWRFAPNQYDFVGNATVGNVYENETKCNNASIGGSYSGWIDLFGWGTGNNPTNSSTNNNDYGTFTDWGVNAISNGGNTSDLWRTLSKDEWVYLFNTRTNAANLRTFATVNGVVGLILMPDGWTADGVSLTITTANYTSNIISLANWNTLESQGCVFLPSAGYRGGTTLDLVQDHGSYWSNTAYNSDHAYYLDVKTNGLDPQYHNNRNTGLSVRLVYETPFQGAGTESDPYLITSETDWNYLGIKVNSGTSYAGKFFRLTEDVSVTTMVGNSESNSFRGTFDGDGHTLTISYNTTSDYTAPFRYIQGATFKNLRVTGSITTTMNLAAGIAGLNTNAVATFEQCATDVTINSSSTTQVGWGRVDYHGGLLARTNNVDVNITDCVCGGSVNGSGGASVSYCAGFVGVAVSCTVTGTRCLNTTSYNNVDGVNSLCHSADAPRIADVLYYVYGNDGACPGTPVTASQLADGSYATALQAGRSTTVWVQDATINQPMLKLFAHN